MSSFVASVTSVFVSDKNAKTGATRTGHLEVDDWITGGEGNSLVDGHVVQDSKETRAAKKIQRATVKMLTKKYPVLRRKGLIERLELDLELKHGLRLLLLCICLFVVVIAAAIIESQSAVRLGMLQTYKSLFSLDDSLAEIKTREDVFDYLRKVSEQARLIQPLSSAYFLEETGALKVFSGLLPFKEKWVLEVDGLEPRVDSPAWSLMAWVQLRKNGGARILRKPLGKSQAESELSCWSWYVGAPSDHFDFGAHDFRGGSLTFEMQERVESGKSAAADGLLHHVALVVTPSNITFYMDAKVQTVVEISRPVTDCSGLALDLADANIPMLGEVTFFARPLSPFEMEEIMRAGYTLNDIAVGKRTFAPENPSYVTHNDILSATSEGFTIARDEQLSAMSQTKVQGSLTRATILSSPGVKYQQRLNVPDLQCNRIARPEFARFGKETSCRIMNLTDQDSLLDTTTNKTFFPLIKQVYMSGMRLKDRAFYGEVAINNLLTYDPVHFPSWCGKSASFSLWWDPKATGLQGGYVLVKMETTSKRSWALHVGSDGVHSLGDPEVKIYTPKRFDWTVRRHVALVFNHLTDTMCSYIDGTKLGCQQLTPGVVGKIDCKNSAYIAFNHRIPGSGQPTVVMQDWRYYREALSAEEVRKLAFESVDEDGNNMRSCAEVHEGSDTGWTDDIGNGCDWYQETRKLVPNICSTEEVRSSCPVACETKVPCFIGSDSKKATHAIWNRIMHLTEESPGAGVVCVHEGVDAVADCRKNMNVTTPKTRPGKWPDNRVHRDVTLNDCDVLARAIDPACSFSAPWTKDVKTQITQNGGFSIEFWWKAFETTKIPESHIEGVGMKRILFLSKMSPATVLAAVDFAQDWTVTVTSYNTCDGDTAEQSESVSGPPKNGVWQPFQTGVWYRIALSFGAPNESGKRGIWAYLGSSTGFKLTPWSGKWCFGDQDSLIQGIQLPGGVLMSPIEVTSTPLYPKEIQGKFYSEIEQLQIRRGPAVDDHTRMTERIPYSRNTYGYPVLLVSPPLLLQTRVDKTAVCKNELGSAYQDKVWKRTAAGDMCKFPYACDEELLNTSTAIMSCSSTEIPGTFFGQPSQKIMGEQQFYEFLTSITDAPILVRNGEQYETSSFLDAQTKSVTLAMVAFSPEYGLASTILIKADMEADVSVDYVVEHFQSVEGDNLERYKTACIAGIVLAVVIFIERVLTALVNDFYDNLEHESSPSCLKPLSQSSCFQGRFFVDIVVLVVLPIVYFATRLAQVMASKDAISRTVGFLADVPWASRDISLRDKIDRFFEGVEKFDDLLIGEKVMSIFYFVHATSTLFRLIFSTSAHPRTAILVNTIGKAAGDFWHWFILWLLVNFGFVFLGIAQFGSKKEEFSTILDTFETLWEMLLGSMLESGDIPSSTWTSDPLIFAYLMLYNICMFMIMFNFIIAIIVESYLKVVEEVEEYEAEQEFFTDIKSVTAAEITSTLMRWPKHRLLIAKLQDEETVSSVVDYNSIRALFPSWKLSSIVSFLNFYSQYDNLHASHKPSSETVEEEKKDSIREIVAQVEERMSVMIGCAIPTAGQRVMERKRLDMLAEIEREEQATKKKKGSLPTRFPIGPTLVPNVKNNSFSGGAHDGMDSNGEPALMKSQSRKAQRAAAPPPNTVAVEARAAMSDDIEIKSQIQSLKSQVSDLTTNFDLKLLRILEILQNGHVQPPASPPSTFTESQAHDPSARVMSSPPQANINLREALVDSSAALWTSGQNRVEAGRGLLAKELEQDALRDMGVTPYKYSTSTSSTSSVSNGKLLAALSSSSSWRQPQQNASSSQAPGGGSSRMPVSITSSNVFFHM